MEDRELEDLARGEFEAAMAFGVGLDSFKRLAKSVRERCAKDCDAAVAELGGVAEGPMATERGKLVHESMAVGAMNCAVRIRGA